MEALRKYGTAATLYFPLVDYGASDFEVTPVTFASGDAVIIKDGGTPANTTNTPAHEGNGIYSLVLTETEMQAGFIQVVIVDQTATKEWEDQAILIQTYGNASAGIVFDMSQALTAASIRTEIDSNSTQLAAIVADTNELQTDDIPGTLTSIAALIVALDAVADAIKAKTDSLTFTKANELDANIQSVNDVTVTGTGASGDEWGP